jgi:hypothetical protein
MRWTRRGEAVSSVGPSPQHSAGSRPDSAHPHDLVMVTGMRRTLARQVALAVVVIDVIGVVCLIVFFVVEGPFGVLNDVANAAVGVLSAVLAWLSGPIQAPVWGKLALVAAVIGAIVMTVGSALVGFDITGFYLAGLVSAIGSAFIGVWLLVATRFPPYARELPHGLLKLGLVAGTVMLVGLLAIPGVLARVDDDQAASWYLNTSQASWLGTYLLYPILCLRLARTWAKPQTPDGRPSPAR